MKAYKLQSVPRSCRFIIISAGNLDFISLSKKRFETTFSRFFFSGKKVMFHFANPKSLRYI